MGISTCLTQGIQHHPQPSHSRVRVGDYLVLSRSAFGSTGAISTRKLFFLKKAYALVKVRGGNLAGTGGKHTAPAIFRA